MILHIEVWFRFRFMVFKATFNNISVISCRSVLLVEETGGPRENHRQTVLHNAWFGNHSCSLNRRMYFAFFSITWHHFNLTLDQFFLKQLTMYHILIQYPWRLLKTTDKIATLSIIGSSQRYMINSHWPLGAPELCNF